MVKSDAQSTARQMGREENQSGTSASDSNGSRATQGESRGDGNLPIRTVGNHSQIRVTHILGGILGQLIKDAELRLAETEECITWYQREATKARDRLNELKALAEQITVE